MPYLGFDATLPVDLLYTMPYVPVTLTLAPTAGSGFGISLLQISSLSLTSVSLPLVVLSIASMSVKTWAKLLAQPMTATMSFASPLSSATKKVGTGDLQSEGSPLPVLWI